MPSWLTVLLISVFAVSAVFLVDRTTKNALSRKMGNRPTRSDREFYDAFFKGTDFSEEMISSVRRIFQKQINFDLSRLQADDDLSGDFKAIWDLDSMSSVEIVVDLEKTFDIKISDQEATEMTSFRKVVQVIHHILTEKQKC